jgi:hypothetical protein
VSIKTHGDPRQGRPVGIGPPLGGDDEVGLGVADEVLDHAFDSGSPASQKSGRKPKWVAKRT